MNRSIVCGVDGTQGSRWATRVAGDFARQLDRTLVLVYVAKDPPAFPYGDTRLRELRHRQAIEAATPMLERTAAAVPDVLAQTRVVFGDPVDALVALGLENDAELMVLGSRGRGPLASVLLGSVSARLAAIAPCPVVVVPSPDAADEWLARPARSRVVCAVDDSVGSIRALRSAGDLAERLGLELVAAHVDAGGSWEDAPLGPPPGARDALTVFTGDPVEVLREHTVDTDASLLVVGSRGRTSWRAALGSVSCALAATAPVPVMVVPPTAATSVDREVADAAVTGVLRRARHWTATAVEHVTRSDSTACILPVNNGTRGRFSTGIEQLPDTPAKRREGRFSNGFEQRPVTPDKLHIGSFSDGIAQMPQTVAARRVGSFSDSHDGASS
jgi:nucleotide-binding universal stress UspA family protein